MMLCKFEQCEGFLVYTWPGVQSEFILLELFIHIEGSSITSCRNGWSSSIYLK